MYKANTIINLMFNSKRKLRLAKIEAEMYLTAYVTLLDKWNKLTERINAKGGEAFLDSEPQNMQFNKEEVQQLISLCHPDKHNNKKSANLMTQRLLELKDVL